MHVDADDAVGVGNIGEQNSMGRIMKKEKKTKACRSKDQHLPCHPNV